MGQFRDLSGNRFGQWEVLARVPFKKGVRTQFTCRCSCGTVKNVASESLLQGVSKSCGCYRDSVNRTRLIQFPISDHRKLPGDLAGCNEVMARYQRGADNRGLKYELSPEQFRDLIRQDCYYCKRPPSMVLRESLSRYKGFRYNGIDRIDNSKGYVAENCVTCCKWCNRAKGNRTQAEFLTWVQQVADCGRT